MNKYIIEKEKLINNIETIKAKAGVPVIGVLKGNGYGFGLHEMAKILKEHGIETFAITEVSDIPVLRNCIGNSDILMLRSTCDADEAKQIAESGCIATIGSTESCRTMDEVSAELGVKTRCHLKIDTGLSRYGFTADEIDDAINCYSAKHLDFCGAYTHFSKAFCSNETTRAQLKIFNDIINQIKSKGINPGTLHCANSPALFNNENVSLDAVRIGSALTGRVSASKPTGLSRTGYLESSIIEIKEIKKGCTVGYGGNFKAKRDTKLAIVPMGHTDGFGVGKANEKATAHNILSAARGFLNGKHMTVEINSKPYPVAGNIGLAHTAVDITGSNIKTGDKVKADISPLYVNPTLTRAYI